MESENQLICRSLDSIERSLLSIFNLSKKDLRGLLSYDYEILYEKCYDDEYQDFQDFLFDKIITEKGIRINPLTHIHWFHGSRCFNINDYHFGIQPLNQVFPKISEWIDQKADVLNIPKQYPSGIDRSYSLLQMKLSNKCHWGPFAMLNRNAIINPKQYCCYNYKEEPEIVRDYINSYYSNTRDIIGQSYKNATFPCAVPGGHHAV